MYGLRDTGTERVDDVGLGVEVEVEVVVLSSSSGVGMVLGVTIFFDSATSSSSSSLSSWLSSFLLSTVKSEPKSCRMSEGLRPFSRITEAMSSLMGTGTPSFPSSSPPSPSSCCPSVSSSSFPPFSPSPSVLLSPETDSLLARCLTENCGFPPGRKPNIFGGSDGLEVVVVVVVVDVVVAGVVVVVVVVVDGLHVGLDVSQ